MDKRTFAILASLVLTTSTSFAREITEKIQRIANAANLEVHQNEDEFLKWLATACENNKCTKAEAKELENVGQKIVLCKIEMLKEKGIVNKDADMICDAKQAMYGCDSLPNALLRKMCYSANNYSLKTWKEKEARIQSRLPASK